jgi:hypothetical protein
VTVTEDTLGREKPAEPTARSLDLVAAGRRLLPAGLFAAVLLVVVRLTAVPLDNTDTYFHLRFGHEFLSGAWSLRHPGSVSTFATAHWVPTQWLPQVVMAKVEDWFGLAGVAWLSGLQQVGLVLALYFVTRRWAEPLVATILLAPTLAAASIGLSMRPQVLSYLFVVLTVGAWLRTHDDRRLRWWLVPMTWLWAMCHGMWPIGIGIGVVSVIGLVLDRRLDRRRFVLATLVPAGSAVAAALTPVGPALYGGVLGVGNRAKFFSEWQSPDFTAVPACMVLALMIVLALVLFLRAPRRSWTDILLLLTAFASAVYSYRTVPVAAVMLMPLIARAGQGLLRRDSTPLRRPEVGAVLVVSAVALAVLAVEVPQTSDEPFPTPTWEQSALSALPDGTKVLSGWSDGSYLMWRYPQLDLLMHGYGDTFTISELQRNSDISEVNAGWDTELRQTACTIAVLDPTSRLAYALAHQEGWHVTHKSATLEMLTAPADWTTTGG